MIWKDSAYFWLLCLIPVLILLVIIGIRRRRFFLSLLGDESVVRQVMVGVSATKRFWKNFLLIVAVGFLVVALARPQMGVEKIRIQRKGVDILVLLDTSLSMAAQDIKPDRLTRSKMWIGTLIDNLVSDRIGIIAFAGKAFLQCPLTTDYSACKMLLDILHVGTIPVQGTAMADAIRLAVGSFPEKKGFYKVIILVTDGEDHEGKVLEAAEEAAHEGIKIIAIGIGSETGEPLPLLDEQGMPVGYKKDEKGNLVMSRLNREILEAIALKTGGAYFGATPGSFEMSRIMHMLGRMEKEEFGEEWLERFEERFEYPLAFAIFLLAIELSLTDRIFGFARRRSGKDEQRG
jgi:Ca-activated chloride channel family protein